MAFSLVNYFDTQLSRLRKMPRLEGIIFAEFDAEIGPVITYQVPQTIFDKQRFDSFSAVIITKPEMYFKQIKCSFPDLKVIGYPVGLEHQKYKRHQLLFNLCFVVLKGCTTDFMYEPLVMKCAHYLIQLEQECEFISKKNERLPVIMRDIFEKLNSEFMCILPVTEQTTFYLKLSPSSHGRDPPQVSLYMVPMFTRLPPPVSSSDLQKLDVLSQKICPKIDGVRCVKEIASLVQIDVDLVARCVRNLHFYGCVTLVPIFLFSNTYVSTEALHQFYLDPDAQKVSLAIFFTLAKDCLEFIRLRSKTIPDDSPAPVFTDVFRLYCNLKCGMTMKEWCERWNPRKYHIFP